MQKVGMGKETKSGREGRSPADPSQSCARHMQVTTPRIWLCQGSIWTTLSRPAWRGPLRVLPADKAGVSAPPCPWNPRVWGHHRALLRGTRCWFGSAHLSWSQIAILEEGWLLVPFCRCELPRSLSWLAAQGWRELRFSCPSPLCTAHPPSPKSAFSLRETLLFGSVAVAV